MDKNGDLILNVIRTKNNDDLQVFFDKKIKVAGDTEYSFAASIPYNGNQEYRLVFAGYKGVEYEITAEEQTNKYGTSYKVNPDDSDTKNYIANILKDETINFQIIIAMCYFDGGTLLPKG